MAAIEVLSGYVTAASTTPTALTMTNSTSVTVRNFTLGRAFMLAAWKTSQGAGYVRIRSPRMHDNTMGINAQMGAVGCQILWPLGQPEEVFAQDALTIETTGSATGGDIENVSVMMYYENVSGVDAKLISPAVLNARRVKLLCVRNAFTALTDGTFTAGTALSAFTSGDLLKANTDYAVLGATFSESQATPYGANAFTLQGPDTGNLPVGIPLSGNIAVQEGRQWFLRMSEYYNAALIPVINSANKGGTLGKVNNNENANTITVSVWLAQLS